MIIKNYYSLVQWGITKWIEVSDINIDTLLDLAKDLKSAELYAKGKSLNQYCSLREASLIINREKGISLCYNRAKGIHSIVLPWKNVIVFLKLESENKTFDRLKNRNIYI